MRARVQAISTVLIFSFSTLRGSSYKYVDDTEGHGCVAVNRQERRSCSGIEVRLGCKEDEWVGGPTRPMPNVGAVVPGIE